MLHGRAVEEQGHGTLMTIAPTLMATMSNDCQSEGTSCQLSTLHQDRLHTKCLSYLSFCNDAGETLGTFKSIWDNPMW